MEMSLHRIIAEIKSTEAKLLTIQQSTFVYTAPVDDTAGVEEAKKLSQSAYDKVAGQLKNLATLKAARNRANAVTKVTIAGAEMTIDEALARKAANAYQLTLLNTLRAQMNNGKTRVDTVQAQIETKIAQQVASASAGTKKATEDEVRIFRQLAERNTRIQVVTMDGMKERIEAMASALEQFATEVDYVLSEANAVTKVEVALV